MYVFLSLAMHMHAYIIHAGILRIILYIYLIHAQLVYHNDHFLTLFFSFKPVNRACLLSYIETEIKARWNLSSFSLQHLFCWPCWILGECVLMTELLRVTARDEWITLCHLTVRWFTAVFRWKLPPEWYNQINWHWNLIQSSASKTASKHLRGDKG